MSTEFYKIAHFFSLVVVTSCLGVSFFYKPSQKWAKYLGIGSSFILMIAGMGLIAKTMPGQSWPLWVKLKIGIWLTIAISGPMMELLSNLVFA
jgi:hypothetical protein